EPDRRLHARPPEGDVRVALGQPEATPPLALGAGAQPVRSGRRLVQGGAEAGVDVGGRLRGAARRGPGPRAPLPGPGAPPPGPRAPLRGWGARLPGARGPPGDDAPGGVGLPGAGPGRPLLPPLAGGGRFYTHEDYNGNGRLAVKDSRGGAQGAGDVRAGVQPG